MRPFARTWPTGQGENPLPGQPQTGCAADTIRRWLLYALEKQAATRTAADN